MYLPDRPHPLFDELINHYRLRNDAELAHRMGVGRDAISRVRKGARLSDTMRIAVLRNFKMSLRRLDVLSPPDQWSPK